MKVKAIKKQFYLKDRAREVMVSKKPGDVFDIPIKTQRDREDVYSLLQQHLIEIIDDAFIPQKATYVGIYQHSEKRPNGDWLRIRPGETVVLNQREACRFMVDGFVRPERPGAWRPTLLLSGSFSSEPARKMFDEEGAR